MHNPQGSLHGGVIAIALDVSMGHLLHRFLRTGVTLEMKTQYLRPVRGPCWCQARFTKAGRTRGVQRVQAVRRPGSALRGRDRDLDAPRRAGDRRRRPDARSDRAVSGRRRRVRPPTPTPPPHPTEDPHATGRPRTHRRPRAPHGTVPLDALNAHAGTDWPTGLDALLDGGRFEAFRTWVQSARRPRHRAHGGRPAPGPPAAPPAQDPRRRAQLRRARRRPRRDGDRRSRRRS
jgi:hypothetical protein